MGGGGYGNGQIPLERLELIANGTNGDGYWEHRLAPGTAARWRALVADVLLNEGIRLYISPGWNGYRPLSFQVLAKRKYGRNAAAPGFSSHGGYFEGRESMAVDVANWGQLGAAKFFAYARKHGFTADYFNGKNGRPLEQWHLIDFDPWTVSASAASASASTPKEGLFMYLTKLEEETIRNAVTDINNRTYDMAEAMKASDEKVAALHAIYATRDSNGWAWADIVKSHVVATLTELRSAGVVTGSVDLDDLTKRIVDDVAKRLVD
jgi:hypothetical protein